MTPAPNQLWNLNGALFELLEAREEALANVSGNRIGTDERADSEAELSAIEYGITQFVAQQLRDVDGLRAPLKALEQGVAINKADAAAATNRAMILQNRYDRLKDLIKQCMVALDQAGEWKPKESRKFESARGSFSLVGNGGALPVEIHDETLIPAGLMNYTITIPGDLWIAIEKALGDGPVLQMVAMRSRVTKEPSKSRIAEELARPCEECGGYGDKCCNPDHSRPTDCTDKCRECIYCGGSGKQGVPGARLGVRGESVRIK